jgi:methylenetetrahydrofolate reductase (NADPH)
LREALGRGEFVVTVETIPGRGANEAAQLREIEEAERIYAGGRVHAISITDNPGGNPALLADAVAEELHEKGITTLLHFTCKDRNRNQMQSQLYALQRRGMENLLVMSGDYVQSGWGGRPRPVFDLDPIHTLQMIQDMNTGLTQATPRGDAREVPASFFPGAVVSPFKWTEGETVTQYLKLEKKIAGGARFVVSQLGYDARKMEELMAYLRARGYGTPVIANVYLLTAGAARYMSEGNVPGAYVGEGLLTTLRDEAKATDKGLGARCLRAAKMIAVARGLGYAGVHIGGTGLTSEIVGQVLDDAEEMQGRWREWAEEIAHGRPGGFYLYRQTDDGKDGTRALGAPLPSPPAEAPHDRRIFRGYGVSRFFHYWVLTKGKRGFRLLMRVMDRRERKKGPHRHHGLEHLGKTALYGCVDCGDCGLESAGYSCPMAQCPKCQRNGPCGGSKDGWCEVYPQERFCIHFKAYYRLRKHGELSKLDRCITPPNNWELFETSAWSNYTHGRDNAAHRQYLPPQGERARPGGRRGGDADGAKDKDGTQGPRQDAPQ